MTAGLTIRTGSVNDVPALETLLGRRVDASQLRTVRGQRHLLVLDAPDGGLAAAAMLVLEGTRGHLALLAIAPRFEGQGLEDRMIAVVEAVATAFGAETLDVPALRAA